MAATAFTGKLLTDARAELAELDRQRALLHAQVALLELAGRRSRRQVLADADAPDDLVSIMLELRQQPLTVPELAALLTRPYRGSYGWAPRRTLRHLKRKLDERGGRDLDRERLSAAVIAIARARRWPGTVRARILLEEGQFRPFVLEILRELSQGDPDIAVMLGMHSDTHTWGQDVLAPAALRSTFDDVPWFTVGTACTLGRCEVAFEQGVRERLTRLGPIEVALPVAGQISPLQSRSAGAVLERVEVLESLVAGILAEPSRRGDPDVA